jgi:hypothetical protein
LERNKRKFHYALYKETLPIKDEYGNDSGQTRIVYDKPVEARANVSAATGEAQMEQFGNSVAYDRVIISDDMECPIDENSVLCVDCEPSYNEDGDLVYDYIVRRVARSLNTVSYAISKVKVS